MSSECGVSKVVLAREVLDELEAPISLYQSPRNVDLWRSFCICGCFGQPVLRGLTISA